MIFEIHADLARQQQDGVRRRARSSRPAPDRDDETLRERRPRARLRGARFDG